MTREPSATESKPARAARPGFSFPRECRILRSSDFRCVYEKGSRVTCPYFAAFCLRMEGAAYPRVGFTVPRALGTAVIRNRLKRRMREAVRGGLGSLAAPWAVVFNPRRAALTAPAEDLKREVGRVFTRCSGS